ncbi:MAG: AsmA family protein, partial [Xanthomonadales bacterium]|nr:AsmA family protein [Xanthomonadales bacterium]
MEPPICIDLAACGCIRFNPFRNDLITKKGLCYGGMKKFFKWLILLTLALAVGVVAVVYNPRLIKGPLENYLSGLTGYLISLEGNLQLDLGSRIEITLTNVSIAAPDWADKQDLVSVGHLKLVLLSGSLFDQTVVLDFLQIDDLQVSLETRSDGVSNWTSAQPEPPKSSAKESPATRVVFNTIQFNDVNFRYLDGQKSLEHLLHIAALKQQQNEAGMLHIELDGDYNDKPLNLTGNIGPYNNLLNGTNIMYSLAGSFGYVKVTGSGLIDDLLHPKRPEFNLEIKGPEIDKVTAAFGFDYLGNGPFSLHAVSKEINGHYETSIDGNIGDITLSISAGLSDLTGLDDLDLKLALNGPSLGAFTRTLGVED